MTGVKIISAIFFYLVCGSLGIGLRTKVASICISPDLTSTECRLIVVVVC